MDYWTKCSSKPHLGGIRLPTLVLNAKNDPIVGNEVLPMIQEVSKFVTLEYPAEGGPLRVSSQTERRKPRISADTHLRFLFPRPLMSLIFPRYVQPETELKCL